MSLADATGRRTAACCLRNSLYLMPAGLLAWHLGIANAYFASEAGIMAGAHRCYHLDCFSTRPPSLLAKYPVLAACSIPPCEVLWVRLSALFGQVLWQPRRTQHYLLSITLFYMFGDTGIMAITAARFYRNPSNATARGVFRASLLYLPVFMVRVLMFPIGIE